MDVRLSAEQEALRSAVAHVVGRLGPHQVADLGDADRAARLSAAADDAGWRELRHPADGGGPLASGVEVAVVAEELGRALADAAFLGPVTAAELRRRAGAEPADAPETVLLDPTLTSVARATDGQVPHGVAVDAGEAAWALALTNSGSSGRFGLGCLRLVAAPTQLDLTRNSGVADTAAAMSVVECSSGLDAEGLAAVTALGLAGTCADLVGVMAGAIELARQYAGTRMQFDAPIGSFQAVQHMLADSFVALEGSRSVTLHAAWAVDSLAPNEALAAAALAKAYCAKAARRVCEAVVQVHGGIGNTWECLAHVFLRRALLSSDMFGGSDVNLGRVLDAQGITAPVGSGHGLR